jgi:hypothetical protein
MAVSKETAFFIPKAQRFCFYKLNFSESTLVAQKDK